MSASTRFMHPLARIAFNRACEQAGLKPVIVQTMGTATASAGTHEIDGSYIAADGNKQSYCAAVDVSVNQKAVFLKTGAKVPMTDERIKWFLWKLAENGFVAWYRRKSQGFEAAHIHAIFVGVAMKPVLDAQVRDFLAGRDGLRGHRKEEFWTAPAALDAELKKLFEAHN